ncbi:hypothetical protein TrRE_jg7168 [Triparma retinervis]|uniref:Pectin acetylesterase n=1 Tax=Triparma retinervis TaxID=2557542 RepID=A0A9W7E223_9STRA|nr:hypothetical protein TrRE_jg7168 [Triparma retinervis]
MTSSLMSPTLDLGGIFDSSALDGFTKVYVHYCTSDGHMGSAGAGGDGDPYEFRGRDVVRAVVEAVEEEFEITGNRDNRVVFGGASAGARGGMVHLDWVSEFFHPVRVDGVLDSPLWVDLDPPHFSTKIGLKEQTKRVYDMAKVEKDVLGESCVNAYLDDPWKCMFGEYRMEFVTTNHLLVSAQFDAYQLGQDLSNGVHSARSISFADKFGSDMRSTFSILSVSSPSAVHYSQPCYNHAISTSSKFFTTEDGSGNTLDDALETFMQKRDGDMVDMVDKCDTGFANCTQLPGCSK